MPYATFQTILERYNLLLRQYAALAAEPAPKEAP